MTQSWSPPPDPDKPDCPYIPGFEVDIKTHVAPPPFDYNFYSPRPRPEIKSEWLRSATQTKQILTYPPLETPSPLQQDDARLIVTKCLATGNSRGAQILLCSIVPRKAGAAPFTAVAKVFDPLYYAFVSDFGYSPVRVVDKADKDYSREAAAYEHLCRFGQTGLFAPDYFGSWTFNLVISHNGQTHQRPVRLVLIEHLAGACMRDLIIQDGTRLSEQYRLQVMAILLDGIVKMEHSGLGQRDISPRNVIILPPPDTQVAEARPQRVVLIDYNISIIWELSKYGKLPFQLLKQPQNPMKRFWDDWMVDFDDWVPAAWSQKPRLLQEWLLREFGGHRKMRYEPIEEKLEFTE